MAARVNDEILLGVSVVMPVHGDALYLQEALESTITQDCAEALEFVIVLDRPAAATEAQIRNVADPRIVVVEAEGAGIVDALNTGLRTARFDLVARMDSDDVMLPGRLESQRNAMREDPALLAVGGQIEFIGSDGEPKGTRRFPTQSWAIRRMMRHRNQLAHPAVMFRRASVLSLGGYRSEMQFAEDYDLWLRLLDRGRLGNLPSKVLQYRVHDAQLSRTKRQFMSEATYLAQYAARMRRWGRRDLPVLWRVGQSADSPVGAITRGRVIAFSLCLGRYEDARRARRPAALLWAALGAAIRPIEAAYLRVESAQTGRANAPGK